MRRRHAPRVVQIVERAAAAEADVCPLALVVELHRQTDDVVALLGEQRRGDRRVDAARHGDDDAHHSTCDEHVSGLSVGHAHARASASRRSCREPSRVSARSFSTSRGSTSSTRSTSASVVDSAEAEAERVLRAVRRQAHRAQHVRRLERARRAGRAGRHRDAFEVERDQQRLRPRRGRS